jgi:hypothetical protein
LKWVSLFNYPLSQYSFLIFCSSPKTEPENKDRKVIVSNKVSGLEWEFKDEFVAPLSQCELKCPLERGWTSNSLRTAEKVNLEIKTSFGNKTTKVPKKEIIKLCDTLEVEKEIGSNKSG